MKKFGIFLGYAPEQPITNQGIGRLLAFVLRGALQRQDAKIVIAFPSWYRGQLHEYLEAYDLSSPDVELLSTRAEPNLLRLRRWAAWIAGPRRGTPFLWRRLGFLRDALAGTKKALSKIAFSWLTGSSYLLLLLGLLIILILAPIVAVVWPIGIGLRFVWNSIRRGVRFLISKMPGVSRLKSRIASISAWINGPLRQFKHLALAQMLYSELRGRELGKLVDLINRRADVSVWFIPTLFWPEVKGIRAIKLIAAPDIVFIDFPSHFADSYWRMNYEAVKEVVRSSNQLICYSQYVKDTHLVNGCGVAPERIQVVGHSIIDLRECLKRADERGETMTGRARKILGEYQRKHLSRDPYLCDFDFSGCRFIFYSSQLRPHKNFLGLLKAYEYLLRRRYQQVKLILTADVNDDNEVAAYIYTRRLRYDVIWLPNVPEDVLAALNRLAVCAANPSFFEGGFPFTFGEAYSVGTPSIMSNIPVVSEQIDDENLRRDMLFNPYDVQDMARCMEWAVNHREQLYERQTPLFSKLAQRSWEDVAGDYLSLVHKLATPQ